MLTVFMEQRLFIVCSLNCDGLYAAPILTMDHQWIFLRRLQGPPYDIFHTTHNIYLVYCSIGILIYLLINFRVRKI